MRTFRAAGSLLNGSMAVPGPRWRIAAMSMAMSELSTSTAKFQSAASPSTPTYPCMWNSDVRAQDATHSRRGHSATNNIASSSLHVTKNASVDTNRLRVAVDVDEVLGRFVFSLNRFVLETYGMKYDVTDYWIYEFAKIWKCSQEESNAIVHEFFKSNHFKAGIPTIPGASDALLRLRDSCDLVVVTSRQHIIQEATLEWIDKHYPSIFQEVYFGNHFALEGVSRKKSDICRSVGASVLIDDNPGYAIECAEAGINVLLYDWDHGYPWSKVSSGKLHPLITVVRDWKEAEQAVATLIPKS